MQPNPIRSRREGFVSINDVISLKMRPSYELKDLAFSLLLQGKKERGGEDGEREGMKSCLSVCLRFPFYLFLDWDIRMTSQRSVVEHLDMFPLLWLSLLDKIVNSFLLFMIPLRVSFFAHSMQPLYAGFGHGKDYNSLI